MNGAGEWSSDTTIELRSILDDLILFQHQDYSKIVFHYDSLQLIKGT